MIKLKIIILPFIFIFSSCTNLQDKPVSTISYNSGQITRADIDSALKSRLITSNARISKVGNNQLLHAQVDLENLKSFSIPVRYKFYWIIEGGSIDSTSTWKNDTVSGGQTITLSDIASDPRAIDYKMEIKRLK